LVVRVSLSRRLPEWVTGLPHPLLEALTSQLPHPGALERPSRGHPTFVDGAGAAAVESAGLLTRDGLLIVIAEITAATLTTALVVTMTHVLHGRALPRPRVPIFLPVHIVPYAGVETHTDMEFQNLLRLSPPTFLRKEWLLLTSFMSGSSDNSTEWATGRQESRFLHRKPIIPITGVAIHLLCHHTITYSYIDV
jgi:hypothetical protein